MNRRQYCKPTRQAPPLPSSAIVLVASDAPAAWTVWDRLWYRDCALTRSISIFDGKNGDLVWDSGDFIETYTADEDNGFSALFNSEGCKSHLNPSDLGDTRLAVLLFHVCCVSFLPPTGVCRGSVICRSSPALTGRNNDHFTHIHTHTHTRKDGT